jgi:hypothetical protein
MSPSPSAPDVESPDSPKSPAPKSSPADLPTSLPTSSLFLPPTGPAAELPPPSSSTSSPSEPSSPRSAFDDAVPTWSAGYADGEATSGRPASSDTPSTGKPAVTSRSGLRAILGQAVRTVTNAVAAIAAADAAERQFGVWRADRDDVEGISAPAARILYRKLPDEAKESDALDLFSIGLALAAYIGKNVALRLELRSLREAGQLVDVDEHVGVFVPSGDAAADAAQAAAWGVPGYGPAAAPAS